MRIFLAGGTGLIGSRLIERLWERGDEILLLTRRPKAVEARFGSACTLIEGDPTVAGSWMQQVADCDAVINLAGEPIFAHRWSAAFKKSIRDSRIKSTENIVQALVQTRVKTLVNASAIGYYGARDDEPLTESSDAGTDFMAKICVDWERAAAGAETHGARAAMVRIGVVLASGGGALTQMLPPFKAFAGGPIGSGKQWLSWIHCNDIVGIILLALDNPQATGPINGTAPNPLENKAFSQALGRALHRPSLVPTPRFALQIVLGEVADIVATGQRVLPRRAEELGYRFRHPKIDGALADLVGG
jgi:uncharacterized protein (TIGR01777 family)